MNNKKLVSRVAIGLNSVNKDSRLSKRYILEVAKGKAIFLMAQKFRDRSLFRESNLFTPLTCFEMEEVEKYSCDIVEFRSCNRVMKSIEKLPELVYSRYGSSIQEVTNVDYSIEFKNTTESKYRNDKNRVEFLKDNLYYEKGGHLYLPNSEVKRLSLMVYSPNTYEIEKISACKKSECLNPWDFEFSCSTKLLEIVIQETIKEISFKLQIPTDENPNMDINQKSKTVN